MEASPSDLSFHQLFCSLLNGFLTVDYLFESISQKIRKCSCLLCVYKLFHVAQIYRLFINGKRILPVEFGFHMLMRRCPAVRVSTVPSASRSSGILCTAEGWDSSVEFWNLKIRCFCPRSRIIITESFYFLCDLDWMIIVHLDHMIRNIEESTGTASHQNRGNTGLFIQISCTAPGMV